MTQKEIVQWGQKKSIDARDQFRPYTDGSWEIAVSDTGIRYEASTNRIIMTSRGMVVFDKPISEVNRASELDNAIQ